MFRVVFERPRRNIRKYVSNSRHRTVTLFVVFMHTFKTIPSCDVARRAGILRRLRGREDGAARWTLLLCPGIGLTSAPFPSRPLPWAGLSHCAIGNLAEKAFRLPEWCRSPISPVSIHGQGAMRSKRQAVRKRCSRHNDALCNLGRCPRLSAGDPRRAGE